MKAPGRIGILGGTFDPVHTGHLILAESVREKMRMDLVLFVPAGAPPHKDQIRICAAEHRYGMVKAAIDGNPFFSVSHMEIDRTGVTYTVDTLTQLTGIYGREAELIFIIGTDVVFELTTWKDFEKVLKMCGFAVVSRPGYREGDVRKVIKSLSYGYGADMHIVEDVPSIDISSAAIRERAAKGMSIRYLVPDSVCRYITENNLYGAMKP